MLWDAVVSGLSKKHSNIYISFMNLLKITHNAGFFSCFSKRLEGIVWFFNTYKHLPDHVDSSEQFSLYKENDSDDLAPLYFKDRDTSLTYHQAVHFHNDMQFFNYATLDFHGLAPVIKKYFHPSDQVAAIVSAYEKKYAINYDTTCAVFYRGNDKSTETGIAPYDIFITKAREMKKQVPGITFLVQSDETEFVDLFLKEFPNSVVIDEVPHMSKKNSSISHELPRGQRSQFGVKFFAAVLVVSKCKYLVTHSGNCGLWAVLYRGNCEHVHQWLHHSWDHRNTRLVTLWQKVKIFYKKIFKKNLYWKVISS